ncbi:MAG: Na(+)-translocating NADH-quinone reductase subunit A [Planctomycetaceae bacterium]
MYRIKKGLDLPLAGEPEFEIHEGNVVGSVALIGDDYVGMKPTMAVGEGDSVKLGQLLFEDKKNPGVRYTSPGCGRVVAIHRGAKRKFESIVIELEGEQEETFRSFRDTDLTTLRRDDVRQNLIQSGLWTAFRTRPYSKVPAVESVPHSIFITAIDTNPLAIPAELVIDEAGPDFIYGLQVIQHLTDGKVFLCKRAGVQIPGEDLEGITCAEFDGPHPAGLPGTHIHFLDPVSESKTVWHIDAQDVIAIGRLFVTGRLSVERVVSVAGPAVRNARCVRTRLGASLDDITRDLLEAGEKRVISGSVLSGRTGVEPVHFLGRYHRQVSVLREGTEREFLGWQRPGFDRFSVKRIFASAFFGRGRRFEMTTSTQGSKRAMVPVGTYEAVMPLDIVPTYLLRALIVEDTEQAQALGCLELDEEDLALCTFVCPGKYEYGSILRKNLERIEKEG